mgnify:CR=1 FL=1
MGYGFQGQGQFDSRACLIGSAPPKPNHKGIEMRVFKVYHHPVKGFEAVKDGFSWPAFFFVLFWMLAKRLWGPALIAFGAWVVLVTADSVVQLASRNGDSGGANLLLVLGYLAFVLVPGFKGNGWRENNLHKRGFQLRDTLQASSADDAVAQVARATSGGPAGQTV